MNLLPLPKKFDENEWLIVASILLLFLLLNKLPKRFPNSITVLLLVFTVALSRVVDHTLAGPDINFYDIMDSGSFEFFDIFCYITYAPFGYLFIYIYDKYKLRGLRLFIYLISVAIFSTLFEILTSSSYIHFFNYHSWKPLYSLPVYLIVQPLTILFFHLIQYFYKKSIHLPK
ncbi:hypothetical protein FZW96_17310 [Bacillus sp. BGMRC 2118]|nr:hypothetical protein FZW96_17310 [Bacillus sp. BGMRC 2118]